MKLDQGRLEDALHDAFRAIRLTGKRSLKHFENYKVRVLSRGIYTVVMMADFYYPSISRPKEEAILKWYFEYPSTDEPVYASLNTPDVLFNAEVRNRQGLNHILANYNIPPLIAESTSYRLLVLEKRGKRTQKEIFLKHARKLGYDALAPSLPSILVENLGESFDTVAPLWGMCQSHAVRLTDFNPAYLGEAEQRKSLWPKITYERIRRFVARVHGSEGTNELATLEEVDAFMERRGIPGKLKTQKEIKDFLNELQIFQHGDFNLTQIIPSNPDVLLDLESFGLYPETKDLSSNLILGGLKDSAGIFASDNFTAIFDHALAAFYLASSCDNYGAATREVKKSHLKDHRALHRLALRKFGGDKEAYFAFLDNTWNSAADELWKLGAAYDRGQSVHGVNGTKKSDYDLLFNGVLQGLRTIHSLPDRRPEVLEKCPSEQQSARREYHQLSKACFDDLKLRAA